MSHPSYADEALAAADIARQAGNILVQQAHQQPQVSHKRDDARDPVTDCDLAADALIRFELAQRFPDDEVFTEESPGAKPNASRRWVVDPLDGTANYIVGLPFWAVSIALEVRSAFVVGVVYDPNRDELYQVHQGATTTCNGAAVGERRADELETSVASILLKPSTQAGLPFARVLARLRGIRQLGATALELAWVAAGRLDACVFHRNESVWDWAAGSALVEGVGGAVTSLGDPRDRVCIAALPSLTEEWLRVVEAREAEGSRW